jgi:hypothetical protein
MTPDYLKKLIADEVARWALEVACAPNQTAPARSLYELIETCVVKAHPLMVNKLALLKQAHTDIENVASELAVTAIELENSRRRVKELSERLIAPTERRS